MLSLTCFFLASEACATLSSLIEGVVPRACRYYDARQWQQEAVSLDAAARKPAPPASPAASGGGGGSALGGAPAGAKRKSTVGPAAARSAQLERQVRPASCGRR